MQKKKKEPQPMSSNSIATLGLMVSLLFLLLVGLSHTAIAGVGIASNQQLKYRVSRTNLSGNDTELINQLKEQTYWINVTVITISGDLLTLSAVSYNSTDISSNSTILLNFATGESSPGGAQRIFVPANLNAGDSIYLEYPNNQTFTINNTVITNYLGTPLLTNLLSYDEIKNNSSYATVTANVTTHWEFYWDRTTGVLVEFNYTAYTSRTTGNGDSLTLAQNIDLKILSATPMIPEFHSLIILFLLVTAITISIAHIIRTSPHSQQIQKRALALLTTQVQNSPMIYSGE